MPSTVGILSGAGSLKNPAEPVALGYRVNHIPNPSFEVDLSGWGSVAGGTLSRETSEFNTGSACLKIQNLSASGAQLTERQAFIAGQGDYYISAYIKVGLGSGSATYYLRHLQYASATSSGTIASGNIALTTLSYTGNWVRISGSFTRNVSANNFIVRVATTSTSNTDFYYVDSITLEKNNGPIGDYFDGSYNGFWVGSAHNSFSGGSSY